MGGPPSSSLASLAAAMRGYRAELAISQEELASRSGLHRTYISGVERAERNLSFVNVVKIAAGLGIPASQLIARAEALAA